VQSLQPILNNTFENISFDKENNNMNSAHIHDYPRYRTTAMAVAVVMHLIILFLLAIRYEVIPFMPDPPPPVLEIPLDLTGQSVAQGKPDNGVNDEQSAYSDKDTEDPVPSDGGAVEPTPPKPTPPVKSKPVPTTPEKKVVTDNDPDGVRLKKEREANAKEERQRQIEEDNRIRSENAAKEKAIADAKAKADAEAKARADQKGKIGGMFGGRDGKNGKGRGDGGNPGNQGQPDGDPDSDNLKGLGGGKGNIGRGLGGRKVESRPPPVEDNSQKRGTIVIKICVDQAGKVIKATFTQNGSTISDGDLREKAESNARKFRFAPGQLDEQCGDISYQFGLK
jgi:colicin import membrane protein